QEADKLAYGPLFGSRMRGPPFILRSVLLLLLGLATCALRAHSHRVCDYLWWSSYVGNVSNGTNSCDVEAHFTLASANGLAAVWWQSMTANRDKAVRPFDDANRIHSPAPGWTVQRFPAEPVNWPVLDINLARLDHHY
ncbi:MAG: hypothetical protein JWM19_6104, partial [Actinomycetia bacterium]|nr:hypothetical protein [Actinomycetes bacterium]